MKAVALSLCILTGVVDTKDDDVVVLEVVSPDSGEIEYVSMVSEVLPPGTKEGEKVSVTTLAGRELEKYCQPPL